MASKIAIVGDPMHSSLSHIVRVSKMMSLLKGVMDIDTYMFSYEEGSFSKTAASLLDSAVKDNIIDEIVRVKPTDNQIFDLNKATKLVSYLAESKALLENEIRQRIDFVNELAKKYDKVFVFLAPGFFGNWYEKPAVPDNVTGILVLDTFFHPDSELSLGTALNTETFFGRLQEMYFDKALYEPMLRVLSEIRQNLKLPLYATRRALYDNQIILDPSVPEYTKIKASLPNYHSIGMLLPKYPNDAEAIEADIKAFCGDDPLLYVTLGGSAKGDKYIAYLAEIIQGVSKQYPSMKYLITSTDVISHKDELKDLIGEKLLSHCMIYAFLDTRIATKFAVAAVGVMGKEQVCMAAINKVPIIVLPVNIDQVTHMKISEQLKIGTVAIRPAIWHLSSSQKLIDGVLSSADKIVPAIISVIENRSDFKNKELRESFLRFDDAYQAQELSNILKANM